MTSDAGWSGRIEKVGLQVTGSGAGGLPIAVHPASGLTFQVVRGGAYDMGFSAMEEGQARELSEVLYMSPEEMRPVRRVAVPDLLVARTPATYAMCEVLLGRSVQTDTTLRHHAAYLGRADAERLAAALGARLPSEAQWEYFCRAGSPDLFTFGPTLPEDAALERWLDPDCSDLSLLAANRFGLYSLFNAEWCDDRFRSSHAPGAALAGTGFVVKGGGAYFWPWQDQEWVWCASAMRCPSTDVVDEECCARPVFEI